MPMIILLQKQQSLQTLRIYFVKPLMIGTISNDVTRGKRLTTWHLPIPFCMYFLHILQTFCVFTCPKKLLKMLHYVQPESSSVLDNLLHSMYEKAFALLCTHTLCKSPVS